MKEYKAMVAKVSITPYCRMRRGPRIPRRKQPLPEMSADVTTTRMKGKIDDRVDCD
jgi:hypothetical protein